MFACESENVCFCNIRLVHWLVGDSCSSLFFSFVRIFICLSYSDLRAAFLCASPPRPPLQWTPSICGCARSPTTAALPLPLLLLLRLPRAKQATTATAPPRLPCCVARRVCDRCSTAPSARRHSETRCSHALPTSALILSRRSLLHPLHPPPRSSDPPRPHLRHRRRRRRRRRASRC
jgi:hypothetical protein